MPLAQINRKLRAYGGDEEPTGDHVILRIPNSIRTAAEKRDCHVTGLQFGRVIRRAKNPLPVKVYRESGYWIHELEEFRIIASDKDFDQSRFLFREYFLHLYERFMEMKPASSTKDAMKWKSRLQEIFSVDELVA